MHRKYIADVNAQIADAELWHSKERLTGKRVDVPADLTDEAHGALRIEYRKNGWEVLAYRNGDERYLVFDWPWS